MNERTPPPRKKPTLELLCLRAAGRRKRRRCGGSVTQHADEEGLVDQFVALRVDQVELERQAASFLPLLMAVVQQAWRDSHRVKGRALRQERLAGSR